jgi:hypothetical protein
MKINVFVFLLLLLTGSTYCQNIHQEVKGGRDCDTLFWTSTEYPVRLKNDISELQKIVSNQLTVYPEDIEKSVKLTYQFTITCNGINIGSSLYSYEGGQVLGLSKRILKILDDYCIWSPAIQSETPVNSFYHLTIDFKKGKILVIPQNKNEK